MITSIVIAGAIFFWLGAPFAQSNDDHLVFVHVLFRHGARSPIRLMPNDLSNDERSWRQGLGELQLEGLKQTYELGRTLRQRYPGFLSETYKADEVFIRSSDVNRTLASASLVAAGIYGNIAQWEDGWPISWYPIPVHTWPKNLDPVLSEGDICPQLMELESQLANSPFVHSIYEKHKGFFQWLTTATGFEHLGPTNVSWVFDNLKCQLSTRGHNWPDWINGSTYDLAELLTKQYRTRQWLAKENIRLRGGLLLKDILDRMNDAAIALEKNGTALKLYAYSGHDMNVLALLSALGMLTRQDVQHPDFASCLLLELWHNMEYGYHVKVLYRSSSTQDFVQLHVTGCGNPCLVRQFDTLLRRFVPSDWKAECGSDGGANKEEVLKFLIASFSLTIVILLIIIIISTAVLLQRREPKYARYRSNDASVFHRLLDENASDSEFSSLELVDHKR